MRFMKTVNSISGGKTSAYIAKHYPADINVFSLVRIEDKECLWMEGKDKEIYSMMMIFLIAILVIVNYSINHNVSGLAKKRTYTTKVDTKH